MPSSGSSTSSKRDVSRYMDDLLRATVDGWCRDHNYQALLYELLAYVHRDGGQYTALAGLPTSFVDALRMVEALHKDNAALKARLEKLRNG